MADTNEGPSPPTLFHTLQMTHREFNAYKSSVGTTFNINTASAGFHTVNFDTVDPMITLNLPRADLISGIGYGSFCLVGIISSTVGQTVRFQTFLPTEYINQGVSTTFDYVTDGNRTLLMIIAPGAETDEFRGRWVIRHFGREDASLNIQSLLAGVGISVVEGPAGTWTITNTLPDQVRSIASGVGIAVAGVDPAFTITNTLPDQVRTITAAADSGLLITGADPAFTIDQYGPLMGEFQFDSGGIPNIQGIKIDWEDADAAGSVTSYSGTGSYFDTPANGRIRYTGATTQRFLLVGGVAAASTGAQFTMEGGYTINGAPAISKQCANVTAGSGNCTNLNLSAVVTLAQNDYVAIQLKKPAGIALDVDVLNVYMTLSSRPF